MKYFIILQLLVQLFCYDYDRYKDKIESLQNKIDSLQQHEIWLNEYYMLLLSNSQQEIQSLKTENLQLQQELHQNDNQVYKQLQRRDKYVIELWSQINSSDDYYYFIVIYLKNEVVIKITCKMNKCDSEKKILHSAILDGVSAELIEKGVLTNNILLQESLDLIYSNLKSSLSNKEYVTQLFIALKGIRTCY